METLLLRLRTGRGGAQLCRNVLIAFMEILMIRSELLQCLEKEYPDIPPAEIEQIVDVFFKEIMDCLAEGGRVELRGFGAFSVRAREARQGRNPRTGEQVAVRAKRVPYFKPGKLVKEQLNA